MINLKENKNVMAEQKPSIRNQNFSEVSLGYTFEQALDEAFRCLECKHKPCVGGCPVQVPIPEFIAAIKNSDLAKAYQIISSTNSLPAVCGRVCPQEIQCEKQCVRAKKGQAVGIGYLERFVADYYNEQNEKITEVNKNGYKVAIIGSGPSGLACAGDLVKKGYEVTIFEALHLPGGVLVYGIPEFRLPKKIVEKEITTLKQYGAKVETNVVIGRTLTVEELFKDLNFTAVFIGTGAGLPRFMDIPGENYKGVYSANEFLTRINLMKSYQENSQTPIHLAKKVAVIGGGNVAIDAARCAKRLGANEVYIVYRRSEKELPARLEEIEHAKEEGIIFRYLATPIEILANNDNYVQAIKCLEMELGEPDQSGRRRPQEKPGTDFLIEVDCVIMAIGTAPNPLIPITTPSLKTHKWGGIIIDENSGLTSVNNVYAGGDAVTGAATVILAMEAGKKAARAIDQQIMKKK